jgi:hypothetical protein
MRNPKDDWLRLLFPEHTFQGLTAMRDAHQIPHTLTDDHLRALAESFAISTSEKAPEWNILDLIGAAEILAGDETFRIQITEGAKEYWKRALGKKALKIQAKAGKGAWLVDFTDTWEYLPVDRLQVYAHKWDADEALKVLRMVNDADTKRESVIIIKFFRRPHYAVLDMSDFTLAPDNGQ